MRRLAIVSIQGTSRAGGVERVVAQQAALLGASHEVRVFALPEQGALGALRRRSAWTNRVLFALFPVLSGIVARAWAGRRGLVLSHGYSSAGLGCDAVFAHGCWIAYARASGLPVRRWGGLIGLYERMAARRCRRLVCVSDAVAEQWIANYGADRGKVAVLPNAVNVEVFAPPEPDAAVCEQETPSVVFVGRLEDAKGLGFLERLHESVQAHELAASVALISPTPPAPEIARRFPAFTIRHGLGPREVAAECGRADLFLLPSRYEACELSSLEALACGTPVLLNDTGVRPTLERLGCPAVFRLESAPGPAEAVRAAVGRFRGMRRRDIADWTRAHFDERRVAEALSRLCGEL